MSSSPDSDQPTPSRPADAKRAASSRVAEAERPTSSRTAEAERPTSSRAAEAERPTSSRAAEVGRPTSSLPVETERPQRADAKRNRERILESARDAFAAHGADTQMDEVARLAGVGVGTVYRHFPTKESLLGELVRQKMSAMSENSRAALDREGEPFEIFAGTLRENAGIADGDAAIQYAMLGAGDAVWAYADEAEAELVVLTDELMTRAQRAGTMRADVSAMDIPMLMCGVCATMTHTKPQFDWRRHLELIIDSLRAR